MQDVIVLGALVFAVIVLLFLAKIADHLKRIRAYSRDRLMQNDRIVELLKDLLKEKNREVYHESQ